MVKHQASHCDDGVHILTNCAFPHLHVSRRFCKYLFVWLCLSGVRMHCADTTHTHLYLCMCVCVKPIVQKALLLHGALFRQNVSTATLRLPKNIRYGTVSHVPTGAQPRAKRNGKPLCAAQHTKTSFGPSSNLKTPPRP